MAKLLIIVGIIWAIGAVAVPALESWELPGSNTAASHAVAAQEVK